MGIFPGCRKEENTVVPAELALIPIINKVHLSRKKSCCKHIVFDNCMTAEVQMCKHAKR